MRKGVQDGKVVAQRLAACRRCAHDHIPACKSILFIISGPCVVGNAVKIMQGSHS